MFIGAWVAYAPNLFLLPGAGFIEVLRTVVMVGVLVYAFGSVSESIWKGLSWSISLKFVLDGLLYGLVTGAVFAWLWPGV